MKRNLLNFHDGSITAYLERLAAQILLFPEVAPRFEGFTTIDTLTVPLIRQPHAVGRGPSDEEVVRGLINLSFVEVNETGKGMNFAHQLAVEAGLDPPAFAGPRRIGFLHREEGIWLEDVHGENAVVSPQGYLNVFDPVTYLVDGAALFAQAV